ncbi:MAG TPA: carboxypeptidase regulatory-like domain-containing protein, partial [Polyangiaceae bacterium]
VQRQARLDRAFDLGEVDLPDAGGISGVVLDAHGDPVAGAQVSTLPISGYAPAATTRSGATRTDQFGRFRLAPVAVGKIVLHAFAPNVGRGSSESVEVLRDRDREDVRIKLDLAGLDEARAGAPANVAVTLNQVGADVVVEMVAAASEAERSGIKPGDHLVAIDGVKIRDVADARSRLSGPENSDLLLEMQRQGAALRLRTVREPVRR